MEEVRIFKKQNQKLDRMEVLGNTLIKLFFNSSLRFDGMEFVATLVCLHHSDHDFALVYMTKQKLKNSV